MSTVGRIRSRRRVSQFIKSQSSSITFSKSEPYAICFYLYIIFKDKSNASIRDNIMEEFSGILICTTNFRKILDPAMQRRFHILVEFKPMKFDGIKKMLEKYFPAYHISNKEIEKLEDCESVTPGDFGALSSRIRFMNQDKVNSEYILDELMKMQDEKKDQWAEEEASGKHKIGFTA